MARLRLTVARAAASRAGRHLGAPPALAATRHRGRHPSRGGRVQRRRPLGRLGRPRRAGGLAPGGAHPRQRHAPGRPPAGHGRLERRPGDRAGPASSSASTRCPTSPSRSIAPATSASSARRSRRPWRSWARRDDDARPPAAEAPATAEAPTTAGARPREAPPRWRREPGPPATGVETLIVCPDREVIAARALDLLVDGLRTAIARRGEAHLALTGGSSATALFEVLCGSERARRVDWSRVHVWQGDERFVPWSHPDSNWSAARRGWLDHPGGPADPARAAPSHARGRGHRRRP